MTRGAETIQPESSIADAAKKMKSLDIGALPVYQKDQLMGMLTDRDIVIRSIARGDDPEKSRVSEIMSKDVTACYEDQDLDEVVRSMKQKKIRRIPVLDRSDKLVGMVSLGDIAEKCDLQLAGATLEKVSEPAMH